MLLARPLAGPAGFGDSSQVRALQEALAQLAATTGRANINPNTTSGTVDDKTAFALTQALTLITDELPGWLYGTVQAALIFGANTSFAKETIARYADVLAASVNATNARWISKYGQAAPTTTPVMTSIAEPPWYTTPLGIGGIIVGGILAYKLLTD